MGINSPLPSHLREECKKAANIVRGFVDMSNNGLDKVIPRYVLESAAGFAIFTVAKAGFLFSARAGSGLVIARTADGSWSPPSAIAVGGVGFGGQVGAEVTDFLIVLNSRSAVASFMSAGNLTLGGNLSIAVGPMGRNAEGSGALNTKGKVAAMYSYSKTKGLFGGVSVEGSVIAERQDANRIAYGGNPTAKQILTGTFDPPDWAYLLIDVIDKATGLPGGQKWVEDDPADGGAMGWGGPVRNGNKSRTGGGYAFGEGVGAGGTSSRKRSSSLFSMGNATTEKHPNATMFTERPSVSGGRATVATSRGPGSGAITPERAPPSRPWEARRASSYLSSLPSMNFAGKPKERRAAGPSSETYNAENATYKDGARSRSSSLVKRPYEGKPTPSPFNDLSPARTGSSVTRSPTNGTLSTEQDLLGEFGQGNRSRSGSRGNRDLLGSWDADPAGLTANFGRMAVGNGARGSNTSTPNRSRRNSTLPFDDIAEDPSGAYLRETTSTYSQRDWALPAAVKDSISASERESSRERGERPFSSYIQPGDGWTGSGQVSQHDPFNNGVTLNDADDLDVRPFDDNKPTKPQYKRSGSAPKLSFKAGLDGGADGCARAVALFDFKGGESGDLSFKKGDVVVVLAAVGDEGEWWRGRKAAGGGQEGIFPSNYVEVLDIPRDLRSSITKNQLRRRVAALDWD